jgi:hypothetical protein
MRNTKNFRTMFDIVIPPSFLIPPGYGSDIRYRCDLYASDGAKHFWWCPELVPPHLDWFWQCYRCITPAAFCFPYHGNFCTLALYRLVRAPERTKSIQTSKHMSGALSIIGKLSAITLVDIRKHYRKWLRAFLLTWHGDGSLREMAFGTMVWSTMLW